jgi:hypothetical protein
MEQTALQLDHISIKGLIQCNRQRMQIQPNRDNAIATQSLPYKHYFIVYPWVYFIFKKCYMKFDSVTLQDLCVYIIKKAYEICYEMLLLE